MQHDTPRAWFITGASTGFGKAIAELALERGDLVVATARDPKDLEGLTVAEDALDRLQTLRMDVTDIDSVNRGVQRAVQHFGRLDVLVNNAGYALRGATEEWSEAEFRRQFEVNVFGPVWVARAVLPVMRTEGHGRIIQLSSIGGLRVVPGGTAYAATKFALEGLSEGLAAEVEPFGIKVTLLEPGPFRTDFAGRSLSWSEPRPEYAHLAVDRQRMADMDGSQPNDPVRAAEIMWEIAGMDDPPLRIPLGPEAIDGAREVYTERLAELDRWESLGRDTGFR